MSLANKVKKCKKIQHKGFCLGSIQRNSVVPFPPKNAKQKNDNKEDKGKECSVKHYTTEKETESAISALLMRQRVLMKGRVDNPPNTPRKRALEEEVIN